ncbi:TMEM175 family protein [Synechococcus sp. PCC 6312]|uniref:TMEM175 family protein n=1 Tax=Synechococcus sp. (strain ATCC 27167 / PCC 6312) TaxID=195253 RepID=UPI00029F3D73|nr:TMEM175 family protein [Synechococcus sp. PCC 6312]AFY61906.1 putative integral membrane protein [Synechococcus sp. PCC 6312]
MSRKQHGLDWIVFYSDAVFAIAITLISVEIKLPFESGQLNSTELSHDLLNLFPEHQSYIFTFLIIGFFWINQYQYFTYIKHCDYKLFWLNTILLMCIDFLPFPASVLNDYRRQPVAVIFYACSMIATGLIKMVVRI